MNLKKLITSQKKVFGLDIGSSSIKIVQLHRNETGYTVAAIGKIDIQSSNTNHSMPVNVINAIRQCAKSAHLKTKYAVCGICGPDVASRRFRFPALTEEEVMNAVLFEAEQVCPFESGQYIVDYQVIHGTPDPEQSDELETSGVLVAAMPRAISKKTNFVRSASLSCVLMDVNGLALSNCFSELEKSENPETIAILDIGSIFTNLVILGNDKLPFIRDIQHAGNEIINHISKEKTLVPQVVSNFLYGSRDDNDNVNQFNVDMESACTGLISGIRETLRYYEVQDGSTIEKIFVCGGFGMVDGMVDLLNNYLTPKVILWNPFDKLDFDSNIDDISAIKEHGPSLALALGLAMRTI